MARPEATPEQKAEVRRLIRRAAADVYNRDGPAAVSARAIAKEAGVAVGTIYTYFGNLQGLMESLWSYPVAKLGEEMETIARVVSDPIERIRALMKAYLKFAQDNPQIYRGVFLYVRPLNNPSDEREPAPSAIFPKLLIEAISSAQSKGIVQEGEAADLAMMLWGGLHGCLALPNNFGRLEFSNANEVSENVIEFLLTGLQK